MSSRAQGTTRPDRPMVADELATLNNSAEESVPETIESLASQAALHLSALRTGKEPEVKRSSALADPDSGS